MAALDQSADALLQQKALQAATHERLLSGVTTLAQDLRRAQFDVRVAISDAVGRCDRVEAVTSEAARLARRSEHLAARHAASHAAVDRERRRLEQAGAEIAAHTAACENVSAEGLRARAAAVRALRGSRRQRRTFAILADRAAAALGAAVAVRRASVAAVGLTSGGVAEARGAALEIVAQEVRVLQEEAASRSDDRVRREALRLTFQTGIVEGRQMRDDALVEREIASKELVEARSIHKSAIDAHANATKEADAADQMVSALLEEEANLAAALADTRQRQTAAVCEANHQLDDASRRAHQAADALSAIQQQNTAIRNAVTLSTDALTSAAPSRGKRLAVLRGLLALEAQAALNIRDRRNDIRVASDRLQKQLEEERQHAFACAQMFARAALYDEAIRAAETLWVDFHTEAQALFAWSASIAHFASQERSARETATRMEDEAFSALVAHSRSTIAATAAAESGRRRAVRRRVRSESNATENLWDVLQPPNVNVPQTPRRSRGDMAPPSPAPRRPTGTVPVESPRGKWVGHTAPRTPLARRSGYTAPPFQLDDDEVDIFS